MLVHKEFLIKRFSFHEYLLTDSLLVPNAACPMSDHSNACHSTSCCFPLSYTYMYIHFDDCETNLQGLLVSMWDREQISVHLYMYMLYVYMYCIYIIIYVTISTVHVQHVYEIATNMCLGNTYLGNTGHCY